MEGKELITKIEEYFAKGFKFKHRFGFSFYHDWDSFIFWHRVNWRNFTFIYLYLETNNYSKWLEFNFALLGLHFSFDIYRKFKE